MKKDGSLRRALVPNLSKRSVRKSYFPAYWNPKPRSKTCAYGSEAAGQGSLAALYGGVSDLWASEEVVKPSHDVYHELLSAQARGREAGRALAI